MKANQGPRDRVRRRRHATPDGGQMLLLAGFLLAGTALMAIGAFTMLQRTETQITLQEHQSMLNLFLNTRDRAEAFFDVVSEHDTPGSVEDLLDGYLYGQFQTAQALSLDLNATLAGAGTVAPDSEYDFTANLDGDSNDEYATRNGAKLWDNDGTECYSNIEVDQDKEDDGLITHNGKVIAAIFYLEVSGSDASLTEYVVIDVTDTSGPDNCAALP